MFQFLLHSCLVICALGCLPKSQNPTVRTSIVGGERANIEDYPYQLALYQDGEFSCGASIVSSTIAITAAHCTHETTAQSWSVRSGSSESNTGGTTHRVTRIHQHPNYNNKSFDADISILEVDPPFRFSRYVQAITLPHRYMGVPVGAKANVTGWGTTSVGGRYQVHLRQVVVKVVDWEKCEHKYGGSITDNMICASAPGKDACQGDSGGPLAVDGMLVGIVSFGYGCADPLHPGVYTWVAAFRDWIWREVGV